MAGSHTTVEKIKVLLLAGIFGVLLWMALHPRPQVGRFIAPDADASPLKGILLDTATGQVCFTPMIDSDKVSPKAAETIRHCSDLK